MKNRKSPLISAFLDEVSKQGFGRTRSDALAQNICVKCGKDANEFWDAQSRKEYSLSALCQSCQDETFI